MKTGGQLPEAKRTIAAPPAGLLDRVARAAALRSMAHISRGHVAITEGGQRLEFGHAAAKLRAEIQVKDVTFYRRAAFGGSVGAAEAYMDGQWACDDLAALVRIVVANQPAKDSLETGLARLALPLQRLMHRLNENTRRGSRRNIAAHYDLGNDLYRLFLDPTMAYSCGFFQGENSTMEQASAAKFDLVCRKLGLAPGMSVIEIGTGWGGFALHAASNYGCRVTTTTISAQQYTLASEKIQASGLEDKITLLKSDYRDLRGQYDRLVSIEMIEAVGDRRLTTFFRTCAGLLKADGLALIQAITVPDRAYAAYVKNPDFINLYIFPGGCCPSMEAMTRAATAATDLRLVQLQDLTPHYVRTLQEWRRAFTANLAAVRALGYDERFIRMWHCYFCYCEGAFAEQYTGVVQLLYAKPEHRIGPLSEVI
jgi:cyclopropane-fatty-acyl-phospholipid synthase